MTGAGARITSEECAALRELLYANTGNAFNDAWLQQVWSRVGGAAVCVRAANPCLTLHVGVFALRVRASSSLRYPSLATALYSRRVDPVAR